MSFKDFFRSFSDSARDRLKNPVIGAFILSWTIINWKVIFILIFSVKSIEEKIDSIDANYSGWNSNFWLPLVISVFYIVILPYIMALFDSLAVWAVNRRKEISHEHKIEDIHNKQELAAEEWQLEKIKGGSPDDIEYLKDRVLALEAELIEKTGSAYFEHQSIPKERPNAETIPKSKPKTTVKKQSKKGKVEEKPPSIIPSEYPVMKDIVIRDLAKTEREWILIYALYSSNFGVDVLTREMLVSKYNESGRRTSSRISNLSNNIRNLVKAGQLKFINDNDMLLTSKGKDIVLVVLNR